MYYIQGNALCGVLAIAIASNGLTARAGEGTQAGTVVVTATRQAQKVNELMADMTIIDREAIERLGSGTVAELLARQPGIQVSRLGGQGAQTDIIVRGNRSEQVKILLDGVPINSMDLRGSPIRYLSLDDVERVEILRGPAGAIHGSDAIGGVIHIITRRATAGAHGELFAGAGSYGATKFNGNFSLGAQTWNAKFFVADYRSDGFSTVRNATNKDADADGFSNLSGGLRLQWTPAEGQELTLAGQTNRGRSHTDGTTGAGTFDNRIVFRNEVWSLTAKNRLHERWHSTFRWGDAVDAQESYTSTAASGYSPLQTTSRSLSWQNDVRLPLGQALVAIESQTQHAAPVSRFPTANKARMDAFQLGWNANIKDHRWQLHARKDQHSLFGSANTQTASYGYQLTDIWRAHVAMATAFRAPTLYQLYASIAGSLVPNPALKPETARNVEIGIHREAGLHTLSWVMYRNRVRDLIDYSTATTSYRNVSLARMQGWTLGAQGTAGEWTYGASLDYLDAVDESTGLRLGRRAKYSATTRLDWHSQQWTLGGEWQFVGRRFNRDDETQPMGGYALLNLTAKWAMTPGTTLEARADNILNRQYIGAMTANGRVQYAVPGRTLFVGVRQAF